MEVKENLTKQITEVSYLTAENAKRYRPILRCFYEQYESTNYMLYKEDVYNELNRKKGFEDYTLEMCENDLDALVKWGNLTAMQDTNSVNTVEEFKHRKFRYQLSQYAIEIERLVIKLENLHIEGGSLEPKLIERIRYRFEEISTVILKEPNEVLAWWNDLKSDFKRLNEDYQDYIKTFYNVKMEEVAKSEQFILYKNDLVKYLRDFIKILQENSYAIKYILNNISIEQENMMLEKIFIAQNAIVRIDKLNEPIDKEELVKRNMQIWQNTKRWFVGDLNRTSEIDKIDEKTTDIIRKITRIANQILETRGTVSSRKAEYKKLCQMFSNTQNIDDAHKLSSLAFGVKDTRHIKGDFVRSTDNIDSSIIEEGAFEYEIKPRIREYKEKQSKNIIVDRTKEKQERKELYLKQLENERKEIVRYIVDGQIDIKSLPKVSSNTRRLLLKWISQAILRVDKSIVTQNGQKIQLIYPENEQRCILDCEDGNLDMPAFLLKIEETENKQ